MRRKSGVEKKMQITYQNEWEYTNIHVDLPIPYEEDYQIKMIHYNKIKGMLPVQGIGRDGQSRYTFRLENGMSMDKIYEEAEISGKEIEDFMEQLSVITEQIKIFLLNNNHIILDPKLIFKKAEQYYFCYLPIIKKENEPTMCEAFHELTEYFVKHLDYKDTEGVFLVSKIHRETLKENYDLKKVIETCKKDVKKQKQAEKQKRIRKIEEKKKVKNKYKVGTKISNINNLEKGDYIVHIDHGIGQYVELCTLSKNGLKKDYIKLLYADGDVLYLPVEKIDKITKFTGREGAIVRLDKLGTDSWNKKKARVRSKLENIAGDLIRVSAERENSKGFAFSPDDEEQILFESKFKYTATADQERAIGIIKHEMEKDKPMDMLLCGDVGYGKTEVAFRAIFKAVNDGKQVAYLCPTTILSSQQYNSALDRFADFPINIALLNRFTSVKEQNVIFKNLKEGKIDILFGTHKLLNDKVDFKDLGLLIIDEEQRFGVVHKEKVKKYKSSIDVLTLSATPIPRTLQMSMSGIRGLALIETPPEKRRPIQTYVMPESVNIIKDAIYKELSRNGQVFMLYNSVEKIDNKLEEIHKLVPEANIRYAHGRMTKVELENIMIDFTNHKFDILLCTTIIETGIDIPNVNTLIVLDADRFGLSQLYQIRGRIGRSDRIGYAYLMYNSRKELNDLAVKRLNTIKEFTELGSGFKIAMRDLSIRGAGDILGSEQSGFIDSIGIDLYLKMLKEEVDKLKGIKIEEEKDESSKPLIEVETHISNEYAPDDEIKLEVHKLINNINSEEDIDNLCTVLKDRFGKVTDEMIIYMHEEWFEKQAKSLNIKETKQTKNYVEIVLPQYLSKQIDGEKLFFTAYEISKYFRFSYNNNQIHIYLDTIKLDKHFVYYLNDLLSVIIKDIKK